MLPLNLLLGWLCFLIRHIQRSERLTYQSSVPRHRFRRNGRECHRSSEGGFRKKVEGIEGGGEKLRF